MGGSPLPDVPPPPLLLPQVLYWREGWVGERARRQAPLAPPGGHPRVLTVPGEASGVLLGGLRPWSRYRLQVVVFNGRGDGPPSDEIRFDTPEGGKAPTRGPPKPPPGPRNLSWGPLKSSEPPPPAAPESP